MNPSSSQADAREEILAQFVDDLEKHGSQAIEDYLLRHPELAGRIHTAGEEGPLQYFAMPYIEGATLSHVVRTVWQLETAQPSSKTPSLAQFAGMLAAKSDRSNGVATVDAPLTPDPLTRVERYAKTKARQAASLC